MDNSEVPSKLKISRNKPVLGLFQLGSTDASTIIISDKEANGFIDGKRSGHSMTRSLLSRKLATTKGRKLYGFIGEVVDSGVEVGKEALRATERGLEAAAAVVRETAREAQELVDEGVRAAKEVVEEGVRAAAAVAAAASALVDRAVDAARDVASGAMDALKFAADGLLGMAKDAYNFLGKLETAFSGGKIGDFVKNVLNNLSNFPSMMIQWVSLLFLFCIVFKKK